MATTVWWADGPEPGTVERWRAAAVAPATRMGAGGAALLAVLLLGLLVHVPQVARHDLAADVALAHWRTPAGTALALALTAAAQEVVGAALLAVGLLVLLVRRRRAQAVRLLVTAGTAWGVAYGIKVLVDRARPPASLELAAPDASASFPSGHTTTAAVVVVIVWFALEGAGRFRAVAALAALALAGAVAISRVYLGDHYLTDVAASFGVALGATLLASGVLDLARRRRAAHRLP
jgi:undecaprenyl-diphosphatase